MHTSSKLLQLENCRKTVHDDEQELLSVNDHLLKIRKANKAKGGPNIPMAAVGGGTASTLRTKKVLDW